MLSSLLFAPLDPVLKIFAPHIAHCIGTLGNLRKPPSKLHSFERLNRLESDLKGCVQRGSK